MAPAGVLAHGDSQTLDVRTVRGSEALGAIPQSLSAATIIAALPTAVASRKTTRATARWRAGPQRQLRVHSQPGRESSWPESRDQLGERLKLAPTITPTAPIQGIEKLYQSGGLATSPASKKVNSPMVFPSGSGDGSDPSCTTAMAKPSASTRTARAVSGKREFCLPTSAATKPPARLAISPSMQLATLHRTLASVVSGRNAPSAPTTAHAAAMPDSVAATITP